MINTKPTEIMKFFSSSLELVKDDEYVYVIDNDYLYNEEYSYGVYNKIPIDALKNEKLSIDMFVPEVKIDNFIYFQLHDDLSNEFNIPDEIINELEENYSLAEWGDYLKSKGYDYKYAYICDLFKADNYLTNLTDEDINNIYNYKGVGLDEFINYCNNDLNIDLD